ncbi:DUF4190 domain-containing protein [Sciscionella marina]|uniref:DUF4190 domain-containing protein n=1 Tax=Sciscionella marina TaxID=508770 RepID=UPI0012F701DF|nr:DUF4190 domain-containing protein [Sciscionella marina]
MTYPNGQHPVQQPPGYYQYPYPVYVKPMTNGVATAAMILSLCGLVSFGTLSVVGFIMGLVGLQKSKELGGIGRSEALTAIWVGVGVVFAGALLFYLIFYGALAASVANA